MNEHFRLTSDVRHGKPYEWVKRICRACEIADRIKYRRKNRVRENAARRSAASPALYRERNLKRLYGLTIEVYEAMLLEQGGVCAICKVGAVEFHRSGRIIPLTVDHSHENGRLRGLLCGSCNRGLGDFRDRPDLLKAAAAYLEAHLG